MSITIASTFYLFKRISLKTPQRIQEYLPFNMRQVLSLILRLNDEVVLTLFNVKSAFSTVENGIILISAARGRFRWQMTPPFRSSISILYRLDVEKFRLYLTLLKLYDLLPFH
jgi:hypothetical protein